ncbi:hypothetical protein NC651_021268 [Populus alba x Populus x berolinensis]|nr:hypothetical protein NC651_021268 [Populus alba x Populus x berolinensis]
MEYLSRDERMDVEASRSTYIPVLRSTHARISIDQIFLKPRKIQKQRRRESSTESPCSLDHDLHGVRAFYMEIVELHLAWKSPHLDMMQSNSFVALQYTESTNT